MQKGALFFNAEGYMATHTPLHRTGLTEGKFSFQLWQAIVPVGVTLDDACEPSSWQHAGRFIQARDEIRLICEDNSWLARAFVQRKGENKLYIKIIESFDLTSGDDVENREYESVYKGKIRKWCLVDKLTGDIIQDGMENKDQANEVLTQKAAA